MGLLYVIVHLLALALGKQAIRGAAVVHHGNRPRVFDRAADFSPPGMKANELHFRSSLPHLAENFHRVLDGGELMDGYSGRRTALEELDRLLGGKVFLHVPIGVRTEIGITTDRVPPGNQSAHAVLSKPDRGQRGRFPLILRLGCSAQANPDTAAAETAENTCVGWSRVCCR